MKLLCSTEYDEMSYINEIIPRNFPHPKSLSKQKLPLYNRRRDLQKQKFKSLTEIVISAR